MWWAPFTYSFIHYSAFHLSVNMLFLWVSGSGLEDAIGWKRFVTFYGIAAVVSGFMEVFITRITPGADPLFPIAGASGATAGVVGFFAVRFYRSRLRLIGLPFEIHAVALLAIALISEMIGAGIAIYQGQSVLANSAAHWAHIGGFLFGMVWAQAFRQVKAGRAEYEVVDAVRETEEGNPLAAAKRWQAVLAAQPGNTAAEAQLARAWGKAGDMDQSRPLYSSALVDILKNGDRAEAARLYREALGIVGSIDLPPAFRLSLAGALEEIGDEMTALSVYQSLTDSEMPEAERAKALVRMGTIHMNLGNDEEARSVIELYLAEHPDSSLRPFAEQLLRQLDSRA
jgi:membrane associated rhomboid family serine protease